MRPHDGPDDGSSPPDVIVSWWRQWTEIRSEPEFTHAHLLYYCDFYIFKKHTNSLYLFPCSQVLGIVVPVHLHTVRVALHSVEVWGPVGSGVEELSPQQLGMQGDRRFRVLLLQKTTPLSATPGSCTVKQLLVAQVIVPLYTRLWASTRRCVQTSSRIGGRGSGRWCWG